MGRTDLPTFAELLKRYREEAGLSQRALSRASGVNPAIISRMESGDRGPSCPGQVLAIGRALHLDTTRTDALLASAGYWPQAVLALGPQDETLLAVAHLLSDNEIPLEGRLRFREVVRLLVDQWRT